MPREATVESRYFQLIASVATGSVAALLVDQLLLPGTLLPGLIGAFSAASALSFASSKAESDRN